ncbi:MAG: methyl-accepting chemotaxis protein [Pseudomonadota bacterium]
MAWFRDKAPIRAKLQVAFGSLAALTFLAALASVFGDITGFAIGMAATVAAVVAGAWYRKAIADPYVTTVERMEGLAAGDLNSPILFTENEDCVGRLTKAMFTFRDAALAQQESAREQAVVVEALGECLSELAQGDLTIRVGDEFPTAYATLKAHFNEAVDALRNLISTVADSAVQLDTGAREIAHASEDLARRTESAAASLAETTAAIGGIDNRIKATATAAGETVARANQANRTVGSGREIAVEAVASMNRVAESAKGIDSVIEGLDKIAFQTRVLAMNAAVEAGRAGEAGRGFAVVADLVSALAMRSEEEAKRAREQLTATQTDIGAAVGMVQRVDTALIDIAKDVDQVNDLLSSMADDNRAQAEAMGEITTTIHSMDQATQQNAAMVEETSAAARNLSSEVTSLSTNAARFRIDDRGSRFAQARSRSSYATGVSLH